MAVCNKLNRETECWYQPGADGNDIVAVLKCPGEAEEELGRPVTGRTGANLCRVFHKIKDWSQKGFCIQEVAVVDVYKDSGCKTRVTTQELETKIEGKSIILCFGNEAINACSKITDCSERTILCFCHIGEQGLAHVVRQADVGLSSDEYNRRYSKEDRMEFSRHKLKCIAEYIQTAEIGRRHTFKEFLNKYGFGLWNRSKSKGSVKA